jgi:hypothetical protein
MGMRPHDEQRVGLLEQPHDAAPLVGARDGGVGLAVAPRRCVEQNTLRRLWGAEPFEEESPRRCRALGVGPEHHHVVAGVAGDDDAVVGEIEGGAQPLGGDLRCGGQHVDGACRTPVHKGEQSAHERRVGQQPRAQGRGGVEVDELERDTVPELHHEGPGEPVPVGVAEAVGDDDDAGPQARPEAAARRLEHGGHSESSGGVEIVVVAREPQQRELRLLATHEAVEGESTLADPGTGPEHPQIASTRHQHARHGAQRIAGESEDLLRIPRGEGESRRVLRHASQ